MLSAIMIYLDIEINSKQAEKDDSRDPDYDELQHGQDQPGEEQAADITTGSNQHENIQENVHQGHSKNKNSSEICVLANTIKKRFEILKS